jgi:hypothetical protein
LKNKNFSINTELKRFLKISLILLIVLTSLTTVFAPTIDAADDDPPAFDGTEFDDEDGVGFLKKVAWMMVYGVYSGDGLSSITEKVIVDPENPVEGDVVSEAVVTIWGFVNDIYDIMTPIAYGLILLYFMLDVIEKTTHEQMSIEHFFRSMIKLIVAIVFVNTGKDLLLLGVQFTSALAELVDSGASSGGTYGEILQSFYDQINPTSGLTCVIACIGLILQMFLPWIANLVASVIVELVIWSRLVEIGLRGAFAPIGMADLFTEGTKGAGFRYFKKFLAVGMQGALIVGVMACYNAVSAGVMLANDGPIQTMISQMVLTFTTVTLLLKTQALASDVVGV